MIVSYHELRMIAPRKARELVRKILASTGGNISETARIAGISRHTVRRTRDGDLDDRSRRPLRSPRRTPSAYERLIVAEAKRTRFRYRRLAAYLERKYAISLSEHTVRAILRRNRVERQKCRTKGGSRRHLYDYEHLRPFTEFQLDTKHLIDQHALPADVYDHMMLRGLPRYEWHMMEVATRSRFTAYSYTLNAAFGLLFVTFVLAWLRSHNVRGRIRIQPDNGAEFTSGSKRKLADWNGKLAIFDAFMDPIPPGAKHLQGIIENAHRADDEYFLMVHAERCDHTYAFLSRAQRWQDTWNFYRSNYGIAMGGRTPREKLASYRCLIHDHILLYPVLLLEDLSRAMNGGQMVLPGDQKGGKYVRTTCHNIPPTHSSSVTTANSSSSRLNFACPRKTLVDALSVWRAP